MAIYGNFSEEFTWAGLGLQLVLGLTGLDFICDARDFVADITVNRDMTSLAWYGMMVLDAVAFLPGIGIVKNADDVVYGVKMLFKNGDEVIDGGKRIVRAADALGDLFKKGRTVLDGMADGLRAMAKNADRLDDVVDTASDVTKQLDGVIEGGLNSIHNLDDLLTNPDKLSGLSGNELYDYLIKNGYDVQPLSRGSFKGIPFEEGGGFKVNWGGDRILQYHPENLSHHGGAYFKISSGETGTIRIDLDGNIIE